MMKRVVVVCCKVEERGIHNKLVVFVMEESYMYVSLYLFIYFGCWFSLVVNGCINGRGIKQGISKKGFFVKVGRL